MTDPQAIAQSIKGLSQDSRAIEAGYLFAALPGTKVDGRDFIPAAIEKGATSVLAPKDTTLEQQGVTLYTDENPRQAYARIASAFYKEQPEHIVAVTGTNGKTSVVSFVEQIFKVIGKRAESLGTLKGSMTTPDAAALHEQLAVLAKDGVTHLALEASSHGLDQCRLDGVKLSAAAFTNLSHDHLDYHGDEKTYFKAKARLFSELIPESGTAVLNADVKEYEALKTMCEQRGIKVISYGRKGHDIKILSLKPTAQGQQIELGVMGAHKDITLPLVGEFQAMNALCALGLVLAINSESTASAASALENLNGVRGRLESVQGHPEQCGIYVDYAHTPDALENVLTALRPHTDGKLLCVFGCGGDRDKTKRPEMGEVAERLADTAVVTDDNPRSEEPQSIRTEILAATKNAIEIPGRREAIRAAVKMLQGGDVLVIAGKGHEQGQVFADRTEDFDDVHETKKAIDLLTQTPEIENTAKGAP